eukprot:CAMPEP_0176311186 /NCGR_PEP_ID=MMETSP0121_2-20121125/66006_1 /TAXON_ID=160619 /ORGANISM="Kryptoperidinium foliaceum, Strain CCMP 1326" /LENGTH=204 /DNA_ID=CAMNT_0017653195 /DNA_START=1 /DNA_END=612 /DNA_ORIENTATION=-
MDTSMRSSSRTTPSSLCISPGVAAGAKAAAEGALADVPLHWRATAASESFDVLYLGTGERFEEPGPDEGVLAGEGGLARRMHEAIDTGLCTWFPSLLPKEALGRAPPGGVTRIGYTWQTQAMIYTQSALEDLLRFPASEILWAQDETIPHLYGQKPWNHRYIEALRGAGWDRPWVAGAPSDAIDNGWVYQLETLTSEEGTDLGL